MELLPISGTKIAVCKRCFGRERKKKYDFLEQQTCKSELASIDKSFLTDV